MKRNIIGPILLVLFYGIFGYLLFGNILAILSGGLILLFFVIVSSIIPIFLLNIDQIHNQNYSSKTLYWQLI